jgi:hypothetical protein
VIYWRQPCISCQDQYNSAAVGTKDNLAGCCGFRGRGFRQHFLDAAALSLLYRYIKLIIRLQKGGIESDVNQSRPQVATTVPLRLLHSALRQKFDTETKIGAASEASHIKRSRHPNHRDSTQSAQSKAQSAQKRDQGDLRSRRLGGIRRGPGALRACGRRLVLIVQRKGDCCRSACESPASGAIAARAAQ